jgi:DNA-binding NarL/FixJ family response regulator
MHGFSTHSLTLGVAFPLLSFPNPRRVAKCHSINVALPHRLPIVSAPAVGDTVENDRVIRILLADRQEIFRDGLKRLLESEPGFRVMGGTGNAPQALQLVQDLNPDVLLLDMALHNGDSLEILRTLAASRHRVRTIGLTEGAEKSVQTAAIRHGARGTLRKDSATHVLFDTIRTVFRDDHWIGLDISRPPAEATIEVVPAVDPEPPAKRFNLTRREMEVVTAVAAGESNKSIARKLSLSEDTVKHHVSNVFDKLGVFSRLELAVFAFNHDLVRDVADLLL